MSARRSDPPGHPRGALEAALDRAEATASALAGAVLAVMVGGLAFGPLQAALGVGSPVQWLTEIAELGLLQLGFLGAAVALRRGAHPALDLLVGRLPPRLRRAADAAAHLAVLATGLLLAVLGAGYVGSTYEAGGTLTTVALPTWPFYLCYPLGGALVAAFAAGALWRAVHGRAP